MHDGNWKAYDDDVESSIRKGFQIWVTCSAISSHRSTFFPHWKFILSLPQKLWLLVSKRSGTEHLIERGFHLFDHVYFERRKEKLYF